MKTVFVLTAEQLIERCENLMLDDFIINFSYDEQDDLFYTIEDIENDYLTNDEISDIINM